MKSLTQKIFLVALGVLCSLAVHAQVYKGVVVDSFGEPLPGVAVTVLGTTTGTATGIDGDWTLNIPSAKGLTLEFSCIGLATKTVVLGDETVINVTLEEDSTFLDETVVIGYATVKRRDLMGSVSSVDNKALTSMPVASVSEALSGRMAGVQVTTTEGDPDADIKIRVRGGGSITQDSSPLYIVDGFPVESISDIPASTIQSIDVLKDAFSTAIYGSRGANGVVLVTTKSGSEGKVSVSYNAYYGVKTMANKNAITVQSPEDFVKTQYELSLLRSSYTTDYTPYFGTWEDIDLYSGLQGNDWISQVFGKTGTTFNHDLTVSGSTDKVKWTASYAHIGEDAIMVGSSYSRDNLNFKTQYKPIKQLTFDINARYSSTTVYGAGANSLNDKGSTSGNGRLKHAVSYAPIPISSSVEGIDLEEDYGDTAPPLQSVYDNDNKRIRNNWTINGAMTWHIINNLNLKIEGGLDDYRQEDNRFYGLTTYYVHNNATYKDTPAMSLSDVFRTRYRNTNTLNYNFSDVFKDKRHKLDLLGGTEFILTQSNTISAMVENFPDFFQSTDAWNFMASGTPVSTNNFYNPDDKMLSFFGRANYEFDGRYSLSATVRADGSSKFTAGNQWGIFPSAAASWTISNEPWMRDFRSINQLKLRYSYGTAGNNNIPSGVSKQNFAASTSTWISNSPVYWATETVGGKTIMANPDLTWETTVSHNLGLDFSLFRSRLNGSVEVYDNTTKDLLIQFPTAGSGYDYQYRNMGSVNNKGVEFTLNLVLVETKNVGLTVGGNLSLNKNMVTDLGGLASIESVSQWASTEIGTDYLVEVGQPLGNMWGYESDGFYTTDDMTYNGSKWVVNEGVADASSIIGNSFMRPGAMKLKDRNGDGVIDTNDRTVIGNAMPLGTGGFNVTANAYGFDFVANFNYVFGNNIYNANKIEFTSSRKYARRNLMETGEQRWTNIDWTTGELVNDPDQLEAMNVNATLWSPGVQNAVFSDWAVEDGSFLRLSSLTLGYTLPENVVSKLHVQRLRVYATGTNLFCLTNYSGYDPEVDTRRATPLTPGVDYSAYPKSRGVVVGINLTF